MNKSIKSLICILLTLILVFDTTYTKKLESDAFAFVLTPVISKILIASAVACGVRLATDADAQKFAKGLWDGMSEGLKEIITAQSDFNDVIESGFALWGAAAWNSFTSFLGGFLNIGGGSLDYFIPSLEDKTFNVSTVPKSFTFTFVAGSDPDLHINEFTDSFNSHLDSIPGYENFELSFFNGYRMVYKLTSSMYMLVSNSFGYFSSGSIEIQLPYIYKNRYGNVCLNSVDYRENNLTNTFKIKNNDVVLNSDESIILIPDIPLDLTLDDALWQYFTGGIATTGEVEYVIDVPYFPTAENSICPSVPKDQVMSIPVPGVYNPGAVVGKVGYQDIPASFPLPGAVAPPISPPIDPDAGFLQRVLDWLSSIWSKIASLPGAIVSSLTNSLSNIFLPKNNFFSNHFNLILANINNRLGNVSIDLTRFNIERVPQDIYIDVMGVRAKIFDSSLLIKAINIVRSWIIGFLGILAILYNYRMVSMFFRSDNLVKSDSSSDSKKGSG